MLFRSQPNEGIKDDTLWTYASRLMAKKRVKEGVQELCAKDLTAESITRRLRAIADKETAKESDRIRAMELLGKTQGIFIDKVEQNVKIDTLFTSEE